MQRTFKNSLQRNVKIWGAFCHQAVRLDLPREEKYVFTEGQIKAMVYMLFFSGVVYQIKFNKFINHFWFLIFFTNLQVDSSVSGEVPKSTFCPLYQPEYSERFVSEISRGAEGVRLNRCCYSRPAIVTSSSKPVPAVAILIVSLFHLHHMNSRFVNPCLKLDLPRYSID